MICKQCGAFLSDDLTECPVCGFKIVESEPTNDSDVENNPVQVPDNDTPDITENSDAAEKPVKRASTKTLKIICAVLAFLLLISVAVALVLSSEGFTAKISGFFSDVFSSNKADTVVAEFDKHKLTNRELGYYYRELYEYMVDAYGDSLATLIDFNTPLSQQKFSDSMTWQDYFVTSAIDSWSRTVLLLDLVEANNYKVDELTQYDIDSLDEILQQIAEEQNYSSVNDYVKSKFGDFATVDSYKQYIIDNYISNAYYTDVFMGYFDSYSAVMELPEDYYISVRHILIMPEDSSDSASWEAAKTKAEDLYKRWLDEGGTEELFAEYASLYTDDTASALYGGLYSEVSSGNMVEEFDKWCFDKDRKIGDSGIVKTEYGYHLMYFVNFENPEAYQKAYEDLTLWLESMSEDINLKTYLEKVKIK